MKLTEPALARRLATRLIVSLGVLTVVLTACVVTPPERSTTPTTTQQESSDPFARAFRSLSPEQQMDLLRSTASDSLGRPVSDVEVTQALAMVAVAQRQMSEICREVVQLSPSLDSAVMSWVSNFEQVASQSGPPPGPFTLFVLANMLSAECADYPRR